MGRVIQLPTPHALATRSLCFARSEPLASERRAFLAATMSGAGDLERPHALDEALASGELEQLAGHLPPAALGQLLAYSGLEAAQQDDVERVRLFARLALAFDPECPDALVLEAKHGAVEDAERVAALATARHQARLRHDQATGDPLGDIVRSGALLRCLRAWADALLDSGRFEEAVTAYTELLEGAPKDPDEVRVLRLGCLLAACRFDDAREDLQDQPEDPAGILTWGRVLERLVAGDQQGARDFLALARRERPEVEPYLRGERASDGFPRLDPQSPGGLVVGLFAGAFAARPDAARWLTQTRGPRDEEAPPDFDPNDDPFQAGAAEDAVSDHQERLYLLFEASPEGKMLAGRGGPAVWIGSFLAVLLTHLRVRPIFMQRRDMEEVLYEVFPGRILRDATDAERVVLELRAFCGFLHRRFQAPHAAACLRALGARAVARLRALVGPDAPPEPRTVVRNRAGTARERRPRPSRRRTP